MERSFKCAIFKRVLSSLSSNFFGYRQETKMNLCPQACKIGRAIRLSCHTLILLQYVFGITYDLMYVEIPQHIHLPMIRGGFGGRSRFLTYWCLVSILQAVLKKINQSKK